MSSKIGVSRYTVKDWLRKYDESGIEGLKEFHTWKRYSAQLKDQAVQDYLHRRLSSWQIVKKYGISSHSDYSQ
jgi:transposase-like protein